MLTLGWFIMTQTLGVEHTLKWIDLVLHLKMKLESFNSKILSTRGKPIITMLEDIRVYIMQRVWFLNKTAMELNDSITPFARRHLEFMKIRQRKWVVCASGFQEVEVRRQDEAFGVNIHIKKCACKMWELTSLRCVHAVAGERDQYQQAGPSVDEIPKYKEDLVMPESSFGNKRKDPPVKKKSNQVNEASGSKSNLTPEEHAEIMDKEAFTDLEQENRIGIMLSVDDEHIIGNTEAVNPAEQTHVIACASSAPVDEQSETSQDPSTEKAGSSADPKKKANKRKKKADSIQPLPFRIYHKNRGRSERIANLQTKKFKFNANGTGTTPEKAFAVRMLVLVSVHVKEVKKQVQINDSLDKDKGKDGEGSSHKDLGKGSAGGSSDKGKGKLGKDRSEPSKCKRAKQAALFDHEGGLIDHYSKIRQYRQAVLDSNPRSTCHIDLEEKDDGLTYFKRIYGQLLTAMGRDANNQMFPIAWAVVGVENKNSWCWFLSLLSDDLKLNDGAGLTVISDGHKFEIIVMYEIQSQFNKLILFVLAIEFSERVSYFAISSNLITYLTKELHQDLTTAVDSVNWWAGVTTIMPLLGASTADSYAGRFRMIWISSIIYIMGLGILALSQFIPTLKPCGVSSGGLGILALSQFIPTLKPCGVSSGVCDNPTKIHEMAFFTGISFLSDSISIVEDNLGWGRGNLILTAIMFIAVIVFYLGKPFYSPDLFYEPGNPQRKLLCHTYRLKFFDKACIVENNEITEGKKPSPWKLTVTQVEETKLIVNVIPIWLTSLLFGVCFAQGSTFFVKQSSTMDRNVGRNFEIPPASIHAISAFGMLTCVICYDRFITPMLRRITGKERGISILQRVGIGMFLSIVLMVVAAFVEKHRLIAAEKEGSTFLSMSVYWLAPQYLIMGIGDGFTLVGLQEFFYIKCPTRSEA
nr:hypothetical protein [Tanacetum cinerariifolium]